MGGRPGAKRQSLLIVTGLVLVAYYVRMSRNNAKDAISLKS